MVKYNVLFLLLITGVSACSSYGVIENRPIKNYSSSDKSYSFNAFRDTFEEGDTSISLAFSGGGTRAAALSYGVLKGLKSITIPTSNGPKRLLDEVDAISSVSGGSFTAAYYGLHGEDTFNTFENTFLRRDVQKELTYGLFNPMRWFSSKGRTEMAVNLYQSDVFKGATFADIKRSKGSPMIVINTSDLGYGVRFSYLQEYFDLLCSDLSSFSIARAVASSSAVPVLFNPVVIENRSDCKEVEKPWLNHSKKRIHTDPNLKLITEGLDSYANRKKDKYVHFVDGGITDNLGLRSIIDIVEVSGGVKSILEHYKKVPPKRMVVISVNAATYPKPEMDKSNKQPSIAETVSAMSDVQLHRYDVATTSLMERKLKQWALDSSTPERPVKNYFIQLNVEDIVDTNTREFVNEIPTSFSLSNKQVDTLINKGQSLLKNNPEFKRLMADIKAEEKTFSK